MTGKGTIDDPYIVATWDEFLDVCDNGSNTYVECARNVVWDMNEIAPNGIASGITLSANIDGSGATIRNLVSDINNPDAGVFNMQLGYLKNINIENCYLQDGTALFMQHSYASNYDRCIITGYLAHGSAVFRSSSSRWHNMNRSLISVDLFDDGTPSGISDQACCNFSDTVFILDGNSRPYTLIGSNVRTGSTSQYLSTMTNCRVKGRLSAPLIRSTPNSRFNTVNAILESSVSSLGKSPQGNTGIWLVNRDLIKHDDIRLFIENSSGMNMELLTSDQMKDPLYLRSEGFPVPISTT